MCKESFILGLTMQFLFDTSLFCCYSREVYTAGIMSLYILIRDLAKLAAFVLPSISNLYDLISSAFSEYNASENTSLKSCYYGYKSYILKRKLDHCSQSCTLSLLHFRFRSKFKAINYILV